MQENGLWVYHSKKKPAPIGTGFPYKKNTFYAKLIVGPSQGGPCCLTAGIYV